MWKRTLLAAAAFSTAAVLALSTTAPTGAQTATGTPTAVAPDGTPAGIVAKIEGSAVITKTLPFKDEYLERLTLPEGFQINIFARNLGNVRWMAFAPDGTLLVTRRQEGNIIALTDADSDGVADGNQFSVVADNLPYVHGIFADGSRIYFATDTRVYRANVGANGVLTGVTPIIEDLPTGGQHPNRTLAIGPDGLLYITVGSTCNACDETDPENATILVAQANGTGREVYAKGLRNTIGFGWNPITGALWGMDHGSDWRGDDQPPEELNEIISDQNYGWPWCFGAQQPDLYIAAPPPGGIGRGAYCQQTKSAEMTYTAHSAPIGFVFYTAGQFPAEYRNDAFVAMRGSWNREPPSGYKVVRVRFDANGKPFEYQDFVTGWLIEEQIANFGRIAGLAVAPDGSLLIAEDTNGIIYRVSYTGGQ